MSSFVGGGAMTTTKIALEMAIESLNKEYYYIGDDSHLYAFDNIKKELGDLLIEKYPDMFNLGGISLLGIDSYDISETNIDKPDLTFEEFWNEYLRYEEDFEQYKTFEDFKKGEGFE